MKIRIMIMLIICCLASINLRAIEISDKLIGSKWLRNVSQYEDQLLISFSSPNNPVEFRIFKEGNISRIDNYFVNNGEKEYIYGNLSDRTIFDLEGNIWATGNKLFKNTNGIWEAFALEDELAEYRSYQHLVADGNNNIWVTTAVEVPGNMEQSRGELLFFNNEKFEVKITTKVPGIWGNHSYGTGASRLQRIANGNVVFHRILEMSDFNESNPFDTTDIYIFSPQGDLIDKIISRSSTPYLPFNRGIRNLVPIDNKLWIGFIGTKIPINWEDVTPTNPPKGYIDVHRGLSRLDLTSKEWVIFGKNQNFPMSPEGSEDHSPVSLISQIRSNRLVFMTNGNKLFAIGPDDMCSQLNWGNVLSNAIVYKGDEKVLDEDVYEQLNKLIAGEQVNIDFNGFFSSDNKVYIWAENFIIETQTNSMNVEDNIISESVIMYPNPARETLNIELRVDVHNEYEILDIVGQKQLSGVKENQIDISTLSSGIYFLKLKRFDGTFDIQKFIKIK